MKQGAIRLLLIEDNPADARMLQETLADARGVGFEIGWVTQLAPGLERLARGDIDILLLDLTLPDSDGLETFTRANSAAPDLPIVVLTGRKDEEMARTAIAEGAQDYLVKGQIDTELLVRAIRYAIERKQAEAAMREKSDRLERLNKALTLARKRLLEQTDHLTRVNEELRRLSDMKSEFVAAVSHDLRTPLTTIVEGICLTKDGILGPVTEEQGKYLGFALEEAERLTALLNDILDISKIEAGKATPNRVMMDVREQILRIGESYDPYARDKTLKLSVHVPEELPPVLCDPEHFDRILTNLLSNAIKFNRPGGEITIQAAVVPAGDLVMTSVTDTGVGIPREHRNRIFGRFERVARPGTYRETGSGLGLALSRQLVELNGGSIGFESEESKGSVFHFTLPVYDELSDLSWVLKSISLQSKASAGVTAAFLFSLGGKPPDSLVWELSLDRIAEVLRPRVCAVDALRVLANRMAVIFISALPPDDVRPVFVNLVESIKKANVEHVSAAFEVCAEPLPEAGPLLDILERHLQPVSAAPTLSG